VKGTEFFPSQARRLRAAHPRRHRVRPAERRGRTRAVAQRDAPSTLAAACKSSRRQPAEIVDVDQHRIEAPQSFAVCTVAPRFERSSLLASVVLDVRLRSFGCVMVCMLVMAMGRMSVVSGLVVVTTFVVLGRFPVMSSCVVVVLRRLLVVIGRLLGHWLRLQRWTSSMEATFASLRRGDADATPRSAERDICTAAPRSSHPRWLCQAPRRARR
jgi:hypothetical protein